MSDKLRAQVMTRHNLPDALRYDKTAFELAHARLKTSPLDITDSDVDQLAIVSKGLAEDAFEARRLAVLARLPVETPAAPATWDQFVEKHAAAPMTLAGVADIVAPLLKAWREMNAKNKERNGRLDALESRNQALEHRVLELEAQRVIAGVDR